jgi:hypothetical protein
VQLLLPPDAHKTVSFVEGWRHHSLSGCRRFAAAGPLLAAAWPAPLPGEAAPCLPPACGPPQKSPPPRAPPTPPNRAPRQTAPRFSPTPGPTTRPARRWAALPAPFPPGTTWQTQ